MKDLIERQAVLKLFPTHDWKHLYEAVKDMPPAQIRCKDCKHRDPEDKKCDCGHDILWQLPRMDDWFCADAERRTE